MKVDFHFHSIYSDGELTTKEIVEELKEKGVKVAALTDHDAILGVEEITKYASEYNIRIIPALELSTTENNESIHVLGYFKSLDSISDSFKSYLISMQQKRMDRMEKMVENVNHIFGFNIDFNNIKSKHKYMIERPHLADEIAKITNESRKDIFNKYIGDTSPAYISSTKITFSEGVKMIKDAGGIAILAHPYSYKKNNPIDLIEKGVDGVEVFYYPASIKEYKKYRKYCKKHNLIMTGGSDFHRLYDDYKHVALASKEIEEYHVNNFLKKIDELK